MTPFMVGKISAFSGLKPVMARSVGKHSAAPRLRSDCSFNVHYLQFHLHRLGAFLHWNTKPITRFIFSVPILGFLTEDTTYSRTSVARTLMAHLPRLFRTRSWVPWKKSLGCRFGIIRCVFFFLFRKRYIVCKRFFLCLLTWRYYQPSLARTTLVSN